MKDSKQIKLRNKFIKLGVKMLGPETIFFSKDTKIGKNVIIEPYVVIGSKVKIGNNVIIKSFSHLESCKIENQVEIGPYARIRPKTTLKEGSKVGNFVEIKKSVIGKKSKVSHLSYVGDSNVGKSVNIGAGTPPSLINIIFCNQPKGQGMPNLSKFFEKVIRLGNLVNIQRAPKKVTFRSKAKTANNPYHASLIAE